MTCLFGLKKALLAPMGCFLMSVAFHGQNMDKNMCISQYFLSLPGKILENPSQTFKTRKKMGKIGFSFYGFHVEN